MAGRYAREATTPMSVAHAAPLRCGARRRHAAAVEAAHRGSFERRIEQLETELTNQRRWHADDEVSKWLATIAPVIESELTAAKYGEPVNHSRMQVVLRNVALHVFNTPLIIWHT